MFKAISKEVLIALYNQAITMCKDSNNSDMILLELMGKLFWALYIIDQVKGRFGLRGSSHLELNQSSVIFLL